MARFHSHLLAGALAGALLTAPSLGDEWHHYGNDPGGTRYSPLDQIHRGNVGDLEVAWEYDSPDFHDGLSGTPTRSAFEATPLMIAGTLYVPTPMDRLLAVGSKLNGFFVTIRSHRRPWRSVGDH